LAPNVGPLLVMFEPDAYWYYLLQFCMREYECLLSCIGHK
jgi:hypothetical protein